MLLLVGGIKFTLPDGVPGLYRDVHGRGAAAMGEEKAWGATPDWAHWGWANKKPGLWIPVCRLRGVGRFRPTQGRGDMGGEVLQDLGVDLYPCLVRDGQHQGVGLFDGGVGP